MVGRSSGAWETPKNAFDLEALAEPIVRAMMAADGLREVDVRAQLAAAAMRLRAQDRFRPCTSTNRRALQTDARKMVRGAIRGREQGAPDARIDGRFNVALNSLR